MKPNRSAEAENLWGYAKRLRFVRESILARFPHRASSTLRILDIGCGNGSELALPLARDGYTLIGIDTDRASIDRARELAHQLANARFHCSTLDDFIDDQPYDVLILSEVLEHLGEPEQLLVAATKRLKLDGLLLVTVPNGYGEFEWDSWIFRGLRLQKLVDALFGKDAGVVGATDNHDSGHIQFFTRSRLETMFKMAGLIISREGLGSLVGGPLAGHTAGRSARFIEWNARITDRLPPAFAGSWYFALTFPPSRGPV
ncbi:MAG: methyltransferase domain-containing protein [Pyrinomonadaceae bacterium]